MKKTIEQNNVRFTFTGALILLLAFALVGCVTVINTPEVITKTSSVETSLTSFDSLTSFYTYLDERQTTPNVGLDDGFNTLRATSSFAAFDVAESSVPSTPQAASDGSSKAYSTTNVQIAGIDEADFIKTNGDFIFVGKDATLFIVDASSLSIVTSIDVSGDTNSWNYNVPDLFLQDDKLYLITTQYDESLYFSPYSLYPGSQQSPKTVVFVYDISDASSPDEIERMTLVGEFNQARLTGETLIVSSRQYLHRGPSYPIIEPFVRSTNELVSSRIIYDPSGSEPHMLYNIATIDVADLTIEDSVSLASSYDTTLMVSNEHIYFAYHAPYWQYGVDYEKQQWERFVTAMVPELPSSLRSAVESIIATSNNEIPEWDVINEAFVSYYDGWSQQDIRESLDDAFAAVEKYDVDLQKERAKTHIYKLSYSDGNLEEVGVGSVSGRLLNQFSLDEFDGHLRVATTFDVWSSGRVTYNNVFVLDEDMELVGSLTGIAEDEQIYSARFMGETLYLVTFRQIDPLFVIDLSDVENPTISGELKIPGFSSYLHPIGDGLVIGVGRDGTDEGRVEGVQVSLFDVSDPSSPERLDAISFGGQYSNSAALQDHHAFTYDAERNRLIIPVTERELVYEPEYSSSSRYTAQVVSVGPDSLTLVGEVVHATQESRQYYYNADVSRSVIIDDVLYTLSSRKLVASSYESFEELDSVSFPEREYDEPRYYYAEDLALEVLE